MLVDSHINLLHIHDPPMPKMIADAVYLISCAWENS